MSSSSAAHPDQAALLAEVSWLRRLAHALVADRDLAEDLVQETCVAALEHAPSERGQLRRWLAAVLRNALRQHARGEGRRRAREAATGGERALARAAAGEPVEHLVERVQLQRELVDAVLDLPEPYRGAVLLRYFEQLPPRVIAERTGVPLATVQSRLQRALIKLRARLDGHHPRWAVLLLPWTRGLEAPLATSTLVPLLMKTKLTLAAAVVLAAGALVWWGTLDEERAVGPSVLPPRAELLPVAANTAGGAEEEAPPEREPVEPTLRPPAPTPPAAVPPSPATPWTVRLRVLDADGLARTGLAVCAAESDEVLGESGAGGWCVFSTRAQALRLVAADARWVTIHEGAAVRESRLDPVLIVAPAIELAGRVVDEAGRGLARAAVRFQLPRGFHTRFSEVLEASLERRWTALADADGAFRFERLPAVGAARLIAVLAGYEMDERVAPETSDLGLELVLRRPTPPAEGALEGSVVDALGRAVPEARVGFGLASVLSDESGGFRIPFARALTTDEVVAVKAGHLPARLERPGEPDEPRAGWPEHVVLVLPGPALSLRGRVLDAEERPVAGARVWLHDPTPTAPIGRMPTTLEALMGGGKVPPRALESQASQPEHDTEDHYTDSWMSSSAPDAFWNWVRTDASGAFELGGLEPRRYRLEVQRPDSLDVTTSSAFEAGERDALVRLDPPEEFAEVRGRVLGPDGEGVPDAELELFRPMVDVTARVFAGRSRVVMCDYGPTVRCDERGAFRLTHVPRRGAVLSVNGEDIVPTALDVTADVLEVRVEQRCRFEVVLRDPLGRFDEIAMLDGDGERLDLLQLTEGSSQAWSSVELVDGRSGVLSVSARARSLLLSKAGEVSATLSLDLVPGRVNRIEP
jgi:RNA polymerase sigma-70 factor (ECF subfamily)